MTDAQITSLEDLDNISSDFVNLVRDIRMFMRDYPELNVLVKGEESTDKFIAQAILSMLSDFAGTPPPLGWFDLSTLVNNHFMGALCREGSISFLLKSLILLMQRNLLPFSDGGISVNLEHKLNTLITLQRQYEHAWETAKVEKKKQMNIASIMGTSNPGTEYSLIASWSMLR